MPLNVQRPRWAQAYEIQEEVAADGVPQVVARPVRCPLCARRERFLLAIIGLVVVHLVLSWLSPLIFGVRNS